MCTAQLTSGLRCLIVVCCSQCATLHQHSFWEMPGHKPKNATILDLSMKTTTAIQPMILSTCIYNAKLFVLLDAVSSLSSLSCTKDGAWGVRCIKKPCNYAQRLNLGSIRTFIRKPQSTCVLLTSCVTVLWALRWNWPLVHLESTYYYENKTVSAMHKTSADEACEKVELTVR